MAFALWISLAAATAAQESEPQFRVSHRYMRDGVGTPVGVVYQVTNLTDQHICVRPVIRRRDNLIRTTPEEIVRLRPHERNARLINFFLYRIEQDGIVSVVAELEPNCPGPE